MSRPQRSQSKLARHLSVFDWRFLVHNREVTVVILIVVACIIAASLSPYFFSLANLKNVLISCAVEVILATGLTLVLVSGGIDLSVGSVVGMSAIVMALLFDAGWSVPIAAFGALGVGLLAGIANGVLISYAGLNPLVTTLGTMTIGRSVVFILSGGYAFSAIPPAFKDAFNVEAMFGMPNLVWFSIFLFVVFDILMRNNVWFRKFQFLGGSEVAAIRAGLATRRLKLQAYVICSLLASVAAITTVARMGSAFPNTGTGLELKVITAVIVGGCSIYGGRGTVLGSALGVLFLNLISNVLVIMSFSVYWQGVAAGSVLILATLSDVAVQRAKR
jgi:ribose transport system permease protein